MAALLALLGSPAIAFTLHETPALAERVARGDLPPLAERIPSEPLIVNLAARGRTTGCPGGEIVTFVPQARDIRYLSAYA